MVLAEVYITDVETPTSDQSVLQLLQARRILPVALVIPLITAVPHRLAEAVAVAPLAEEVVEAPSEVVAEVEAPSEVEVAAVVVAPSVEDDNFL